MQVKAQTVFLMLASLWGAQLANADDWLMFRRDSGRTAASEESIALPLKEYWSWQSQRVRGYSSLSTIAIRDGKAYFIAGQELNEPQNSLTGKSRELICADAKTGAVQWRKALQLSRAHPLLPEDIGPALTKEGTIFIFDKGTPCKTCETGFTIVALNEKGETLDSTQLPNKMNLARFFLRSGHGNETDYVLMPETKPDT